MRKGGRKEKMNFSTIELFKNIPFDVDYRNTMDFNTEVLQNKFFTTGDYAAGEDGRLTIPNCLYVDYTRGSVRIEGSQGSLYAYNYMRYKNADRDKWYYAFILSKKYLSDGSTELTFAIDVIQTFMFNYHIAPGIVERGHVDRYKKNSNGVVDFTMLDNDINGLSVRSIENIQSNNYIYKDIKNIYKVSPLLWIYITFNTDFADEGTVFPKLLPYTHTCCIPYDISGRDIYFHYENGVASKPSFSLHRITEDERIREKIESISVSCFAPFIYNYSVVGIGTATTILVENVQVTKINFATSQTEYVIVPNQIQNGYEESNLVFTFNQLISYGGDKIIPITNPATNKSITNEYKLKLAPFSFFSIGIKGNMVDFKLNDIANRINYKILVKSLYGYSNNYSIILDGYNIAPVGNRLMAFDYNNAGYLPITGSAIAAYEKEKQSTVIISTMIQAVGGMLASWITMNPVPGVLGGVAAIGNILGNTINALNAPDSVNIMTDGFNTLLFQEGRPSTALKTLDESFKNQCFDHLYRYGYTVNLICDDIESFYKTRYWFNFVKTKDIEFDGSTIDTAVFEEQIKGIYNSGITFWHYNNGNYKFCEYDNENVERAIM